MAGPQANEIDWENMTNKELRDKFLQMLGQQVEDVMASFGKALERMDDIEKTMDTKLDAKFDELLKRLPPVDPTFDETYHETPCSSCSPSQFSSNCDPAMVSSNRNTQEYDPTYY